jgi:hypothetical protein
MNKSVKKILLTSLMIGFCILVTFELYGLGEIEVIPTPTPNQLASQLITDLTEMIDRYKKGEVSEIDISLLTTFTWDRLYVFGPYTELSKLDSMFGISWRDKCHTTIESQDGVALLVFVSENRVVVCTDYYRYGSSNNVDGHDFVDLQEYKSGFLPEEARFVIDERGRAIWIGDK